MANKTNMKKWINALRSGKYTQGREVLETSDGKNCCLGVACRVFDIPFEVGNDGHASQALIEKLGLDGPDVIDESGGDYDIRLSQRTTAIQANDGLKWSFDKIANALEKRYL